METFAIIFGAITLAFIINIVIYKVILRKALRKFIVPYLNDLGYHLERTKFIGLFGTGDLKRKVFSVRPLMPTGSPVISMYIYLYIRSEAGVAKRITARLTSIFLWVKSVEYSNLDDAKNR